VFLVSHGLEWSGLDELFTIAKAEVVGSKPAKTHPSATDREHRVRFNSAGGMQAQHLIRFR
jgi:hypothetical protein